ncbi:MAG: twin-arginine translocase subunit TatC [Halieaceae bacterium]
MSEEDQAGDAPQPLVAHLTELRDRLLRSFLAVLLIFCGLFAFANDIYSYVSEPLRALLPEGSTMIATEVASPFLTPFKLTLVTALFLAIPYVLYQLWSFVAPGMYKNEKRLAIPLLVSSVLLFYAGAAFAYYVVFPLIFGFFTSVGPSDITIMTDINRYLDFVLKLFFAFGLAFEIPIAAVIMIRVGITTADDLAKKRPYIVVGCFIMGMLLTPPDIISQSLLAIPMWILFEVGVIFGRMITPADESSQ